MTRNLRMTESYDEREGCRWPRPAPKFKAGQIVVLKHSKKVLPFMIQDVLWNDGWFYAWGSKSYAAESMIRELTDKEKGANP